MPIKDCIHHYPRALFNDIPRVGAHFYDIPGSGRTFTTFPGQTGYVARKLIHKVHCEECKRLFGDKDKPFDLDIDEQHLVYFQCLDRGGLIYPSN